MTSARSGPDDEPVRIGVVGVGNMGRHHARVCAHLPGVRLVGVTDQDTDRAAEIAEEYGTVVRELDSLLSVADGVTVAVPTAYHADLAEQAIDADVGVLVEKPFVQDPDRGRSLVERARRNDVTLATGHVERHNPAVATLREVLADREVIAVDAHRLGPPRDVADDDVVMDLMIHDLDVVHSLVDSEVRVVGGAGACDGQYVTATLDVGGGRVANLTASRVTQQKVRTLSVTARDCRVVVDYIDRSVRIHRRSVPEYVDEAGELRYRHASTVERPVVEDGEPLARELQDFADAIATGSDPLVTGEDGLAAVELARMIDSATARERPVEVAR